MECLFPPLVAERPQRVRVKRLLQEPEHGFFLVPEMFACGRQRCLSRRKAFAGSGRAVDGFELAHQFS